MIDFHVHAFPRKIRCNRENYFTKEPEFKALYGTKKSKLVGFSNIIRMMDDQDIKLSVIFGFPWRDYDTCRKNNNYIIEVVKKFPTRFKGFCCVNSLNIKSADEVERCLSLGLSGVGELAFYDGGINEQNQLSLQPIMKLCRKYDVPVLLHTNEEIGHSYPGKTQNTLFQIYETISRFRKNKIILSHWGGGFFF